MNKIFLIPFFFFIFLNTANADQPFNCVDSDGNRVITTNPQEGMKCTTMESDEEESNYRNTSVSKGGSPKNLFEVCEKLSHRSEEINDELKSYDKLRSELQKEQFEIKKQNYNSKWGSKTESAASKSVREKQDKMNREMSLLYEEKSLIGNDMRMNKCDELKRDLSRLNQETNNYKGYPQKTGKSTVIMKNGGTVILRN